MSKSYKVGERLELVVEKIVPNGLGMCFAENLTVFVPLSVAGDKLCVEIKQIKGKTAFAQIEEIIEGSGERAAPPCEYFGICGGCDFQQMSYSAQLESKIGIIRDSLTRIGKIDFAGEIPIIPSPEQYGYRIRSQWHADTQAQKIGYFKRQSHEIVEAETCKVLVSELEGKLNELRGSLDWEGFSFKEINIEAAAGSSETSVYSYELDPPAKDIEATVNGDKFFFNAQTFFQGNKYLVESLVREAIDEFEGDTALDLYCGVGLFAVPLARKFRKVYAVETNERSLAFGKRNQENAGLKNIEFVGSRIKSFVKEISFENEKLDLIVLDPPRSGVKQGTLQNIAELGSSNISYVSCNPTTLSRDLRILIDHGYSLSSITALDLFPQTHHVETIAHLSRT